jgi:hypothetical protein
MCASVAVGKDGQVERKVEGLVVRWTVGVRIFLGAFSRGTQLARKDSVASPLSLRNAAEDSQGSDRAICHSALAQ